VKIRGLLVNDAGIASKKETFSPTARVNRMGSRHHQFSIGLAEAKAAFADAEAVLNHVTIMPGRLFNRETGFRIAAFDPGSIFSCIPENYNEAGGSTPIFL
jgi:hypothetical protein